MDWLRKKSRLYIAVITPVVLAVPVMLHIGTSGGDMRPYKPSIVLPDTTPGLEAETELVQLAFLSNDENPLISLPYPFSVSPLRAVISNRSADNARYIDWRLFKDELGSYEIELRSDPDELVNIELAARAINGTIVQPFDTFSFNQTVGERSEERGFRPGLMFSGGEVVTGMGGGVCLVSTALYNSALHAGYKIIERAHHSGPVRYAAPGLDSAVVYGTLDMKFKNDNISPVLIRARVENSKLIVSVNGRKKPGYEVEVIKEDYKELPYKIIEMEDPEAPEGESAVKVPARTGFEVTVIRVIKQDGKVIKREVICQDRIPARDKVVLIPPKPKEVQVEETKPTQPAEPAVEAPQSINTELPEHSLLQTEPEGKLEIELGVEE